MTKPKLYSFDEAVTARINAVSTYPGNQFLSKEAAIDLVSRYCVCLMTSLLVGLLN